MALAIAEAASAADELISKFNEMDSKFQKDVVERLGGSMMTRLLNGKEGTGREQEMIGEHETNNMLQDSPQGMQQENQSYGRALQTRLARLQRDTAAYKKAGDSGVNYSANIEALQDMIKVQEKEGKIIDGNIEKDKLQTKVEGERAAAAGKAGAHSAAEKAARDAMEVTRDLSRLNTEAVQSQMTGEALLGRMRLDEWNAEKARLVEKHATTTQMQEAEDNFNLKSANDEAKRLVDLQNKAALHIESLHVNAMKPGADKIQAEHGLRLHQINTDATLTPDEASAERVDAAEQMNTKLGELADANAKKQRAAADKASEQLLRNHAEDLKYEQDAQQAENRVKEAGAMGWVASYKNAVLEIEDQEKQRQASLTANAKNEGLTYDQVAQRRVDIERQASAEIQQQQQAMSQKLSGIFEQAFKDPIGTIKSTMEKLMFDLLAQWVLHFKMVQGLLGGSLNGGQMSGGAAHLGSTILGGVAGHALGGGGGTAAQLTAQAQAGAQAGGQTAGASSSPSGASYRAPYAAGGVGPAGPISSSGMVGGAGSASSVSGDISSATGLAGLTGIGSGSGGGGGGGGNVFDDQGNATYTGMIPDPSAGSGLATLGKYAGAAGAGYMAEQTTVSTFDQGGSGKAAISGILGDAAAGATIGSVIPGIGTAIGAGVGAAVGAAAAIAGGVMDMGGRIAARTYYEKTLFPAIEADRNGQTSDPISAISDVNKQSSDGYHYMATHFGGAGADWVKANYLDKEVALALSQITAHVQGGSMYTGRQAMQFHSGGYVGGFGDFGTGGNEGLIHALMGETMMNQSATATHAPVLNAMNDGASPADVASMYLASAKSSSNPSSAAPSGGDTHYHVHTLDTQTMTGWLRNGGARMISKSQNNLASQYAGDGVIG